MSQNKDSFLLLSLLWSCHCHLYLDDDDGDDDNNDKNLHDFKRWTKQKIQILMIDKFHLNADDDDNIIILLWINQCSVLSCVCVCVTYNGMSRNWSKIWWWLLQVAKH